MFTQAISHAGHSCTVTKHRSEFIAVKMPSEIPGRLANRTLGVAPLQILVTVDSVDIFGTSDFVTSLQQWHVENQPTHSITATVAGRNEMAAEQAPHGKNVTGKDSSKFPRIEEKDVSERRLPTELVRVSSCASPKDLYTRDQTVSVNLPRVATLQKKPSVSTPRTPLHKQSSISTPRTALQKQPSVKRPRTPLQKQPPVSIPRAPIQERQPPWKQGSGDGKPQPCVSRHMQRKLGSQRSIEQHSSSERSGLSREQNPGVQEQTARSGEKAVPTPHSSLPRVQEETAGSAEQTGPISDSCCEDSPHMPVVQEQGAGTVQKGEAALHCPDKRCEDSALTAESGGIAARDSATDILQGVASKEEADVATIATGTDKQPDVAASKEEAVTGDKGSEREPIDSDPRTEFEDWAAPVCSAGQLSAEGGASWTTKIAGKVASSQAALGHDPLNAVHEPALTIESVPQGDATGSGAIADASSACSALSETTRRGFRMPWSPKGGRLLPQWGSMRSPRLTKDGALARIDLKNLVTKKLPKVKVKDSRGEKLKVKQGRSWRFACFEPPPVQSS